MIDEMKVEVPAHEQLVQLRRKFNKECEDMYPGVVYPGDCYVFDMVLGIDPRLIVADQAVTKKTYKQFVLDPSDKKKVLLYNAVSGEVEAVKVVRKFDSKQQKAIREWWHLLSPEIRGE